MLPKIKCFDSHQQTTSPQEEPVQALGSTGALGMSDSPALRSSKAFCIILSWGSRIGRRKKALFPKVLKYFKYPNKSTIEALNPTKRPLLCYLLTLYSHSFSCFSFSL